MGRATALIATCVLLLVEGAAAAPRESSVSWRTVGGATTAALPAGRLLPPSTFTGSSPAGSGSLAWRVAVFSSAADVATALPGLTGPLRAALAHARASTNFGYRRLLLVAVANRAGCCPFRIAAVAVGGRTVELTVRQSSCGACTSPGGFRIVLVSVPRATFPSPRRLAVAVQPPPSCPAGYSYAGFVSHPAAGLTATLTMRELPQLVTGMDHALAYASVVARDANQVPREWLQVGIGRGAIGAYPDDGRAWVYVEAQTVAGYQLTELEPAPVGVPVVVAFDGSGASWTVSIDGKQAYAANLGTPATGTSTAVEVYRATDGDSCPSLDFVLDGVVPKGARRGLLPLLDESPSGWRVQLG